MRAPIFFALLAATTGLCFPPAAGAASSRRLPSPPPASGKVRWTPVRFSAWPHPDGAFPAVDRVRGLSIGVMVSHDREAYGVQIAPVPSSDRGAGIQCGAAPESGRFHGFQTGFVSATGNYLAGVQISPLNNIDFKRTRVRGVQAGLFNGGGNVKGCQVGAMNRSVALRGVQAGAWNQSATSKVSAQIGAMNVLSGPTSGGLQIGAVNRNRGRFGGAQMGAINLNRDRIGGIQIGIINSTRSLKGVQLGLLNRVSSRRFLWGMIPGLNIGW